MVDNVKVINFLQDFGCAKLEHLQILFEDKKKSFKQILNSNMVSKRGDIFVHNTRTLNEKMLIALDILCVFKPVAKRYCPGSNPSIITFYTTENWKCNILIADKENQKGMVKFLNSKIEFMHNTDKLLVVFYDDTEVENIECEIPIYYIIYPKLEVIYDKKT